MKFLKEDIEENAYRGNPGDLVKDKVTGDLWKIRKHYQIGNYGYVQIEKDGVIRKLKMFADKNSPQDIDRYILISENESLKEDIDLETNDTDDLYAVWYPYVGKRIITKDIMIKTLKEEIDRVEHGSSWDVGKGLAFRFIQAIDDGEPLVPNRSDEEFFKAMHWED